MAQVTCACDPTTYKLCKFHFHKKEQSGCTLSFSDCMLNHPEGHDRVTDSFRYRDIRPIKRYNVDAKKYVAWKIPQNNKDLIKQGVYCTAYVVEGITVGQGVEQKLMTVHECPEHWVIVTWIS